jgi:hypothetical protein
VIINGMTYVLIGISAIPILFIVCCRRVGAEIGADRKKHDALAAPMQDGASCSVSAQLASYCST